MTQRDAIDFSNPRSILEESEEAAEEESRRVEGNHGERGAQFREVLTWILYDAAFMDVPFRVYIAAFIASPENVAGMTLEEIARLNGKNLSATQELVAEFEGIFGARGARG